EGTTVVITTHDMEEAATLSDRVAIIDHGKLLALDTPASLVHDMAGERTLDCRVQPGEAQSPGEVCAGLERLDIVDRVEEFDDEDAAGWHFRVYVQAEPA